MSNPASDTSPPILIVPGLHNSGPQHWQTHWQRAIPGAERVEQSEWSVPRLGDWTAALAEAVRRRPGAILVAHSLGCALIAHLSLISNGRNIGGALLVSPADVNREGPSGRLLQGFSPVPLGRLPFPAMVVASRNDPYVTFERAQVFAAGWGASLVDAGEAGHINVASGHGQWGQGRALLRQLTEAVAARKAPA